MAPSIGRIQKRKTNLLQIIIFGLQRAAGPYRRATNRLHRHLIRCVASAVVRQVSDGLPYRIVQIGIWPGSYSFPTHGVPQMCR
jgi:hypothetical protein